MQMSMCLTAPGRKEVPSGLKESPLIMHVCPGYLVLKARVLESAGYQSQDVLVHQACSSRALSSAACSPPHPRAPPRASPSLACVCCEASPRQQEAKTGLFLSPPRNSQCPCPDVCALFFCDTDLSCYVLFGFLSISEES